MIVGFAFVLLGFMDIGPPETLDFNSSGYAYFNKKHSAPIYWWIDTNTVRECFKCFIADDVHIQMPTNYLSYYHLLCRVFVTLVS